MIGKVFMLSEDDFERLHATEAGDMQTCIEKGNVFLEEFKTRTADKGVKVRLLAAEGSKPARLLITDPELVSQNSSFAEKARVKSIMDYYTLGFSDVINSLVNQHNTFISMIGLVGPNPEGCFTIVAAPQRGLIAPFDFHEDTVLMYSPDLKIEHTPDPAMLLAKSFLEKDIRFYNKHFVRDDQMLMPSPQGKGV